MKKQLVTVLALAGIVAGSTMAFAAAGSHGGGILNSKHDMNEYISAYGGTPDKDQRVCAFCHTPHHSLGTGDTAETTISVDGNVTVKQYAVYYPLWSRALDPQADIISYTSETFNPTGIFYDPLAGPSRLCMTCHDGTIAVDSYYGQAGGTASTGEDELTMFGSGNFGIHKNEGLGNDHPVGFVYKDMVDNVDMEIKTSTNVFLNTSKTIESALAKIEGVGSVMTCASCHDVHNGDAVKNVPTGAGESGRGYFLLAAQKDSAICLSCHDK